MWQTKLYDDTMAMNYTMYFPHFMNKMIRTKVLPITHKYM